MISHQLSKSSALLLNKSQNEFTNVKNASDVPPFRDNMMTRIELNSK